MESEENPRDDESDVDSTQIGAKREENPRRRGRPFEPGNRAAVGHGRPKKDFDLVTRCQDLTEEIIEHYGERAKTAETGAEVEMGKVVLAYGHGKPRVRMEHSGPGGGPIRIAAAETTEQKRARARRLQRTAAERVTSGSAPAALAAVAGNDDADPEGAPEPEDVPSDGAPGAE